MAGEIVYADLRRPGGGFSPAEKCHGKHGIFFLGGENTDFKLCWRWEDFWVCLLLHARVEVPKTDGERGLDVL